MIEILRLSGTTWIPIEYVEVNITDSLDIEGKTAEIKTMVPLRLNEVIKIYDDFGKFWGPAIVSSSEYSDGVYTHTCEFLYTKILKFFIINYDSGATFFPNAYTYRDTMPSVLNNYFNSIPIYIPDVDYDSSNSFVDYSKSNNVSLYKSGFNEYMATQGKGSWSVYGQYGGEADGWPSPISVSSDYEPGILATYVMAFGKIGGNEPTSNIIIGGLADSASKITNNISNTNELSRIRVEYSYNGGITWLPAKYTYSLYGTINFDNAHFDIPYPIIYRLVYNGSIGWLNIVGLIPQDPSIYFYRTYISVSPAGSWSSIFSELIVDGDATADAILNADEDEKFSGVVSALEGFKNLGKYLKVPNKYPGYYLFYVRPDGTLVFGIDSIISDKSDSVILYQDEDILVDMFRNTGENKPSAYVLKNTANDSSNDVLTDGSHFRSPEKVGPIIDISEETDQRISTKYMETVHDEGMHMTGLECTLFSEKAKELNVGDIVRVKLKDLDEEFIMQLNQKIYDGITVKAIFGEDIRHMVTAFKTLVSGK